jgi:hypothetical protein
MLRAWSFPTHLHDDRPRVGLASADKTKSKRLLLYAVVTTVAGAAFTPALAQASCSTLWHRRDQIYWQAGCCFKTAPAVRAFGNAGCSFANINDVPLSAKNLMSGPKASSSSRRGRSLGALSDRTESSDRQKITPDQ